MTLALQVQDLSVRFNRRIVTQDCSLSMRRGETVALIGHNGAGKSVTLKAIAGLVAASGTVTLEGSDITSKRAEQRVALGLVFVAQERRVFARMSVDQNIRLGAYALRRRAPERYEEVRSRVLALFPLLAERLAMRADALSSGQQTLLAIARALMAEPKFLLLDEPFGRLAPAAADDLADHLAHIAREDVGILLAEHDDRALRIAQRSIVMESGRIKV